VLSNVQKALKTWRSLVALLPFLTEEEVLDALRTEQAGRNRRSVIERLVKRATRLSEISASTTYSQEFLDGNCQHRGPQGQDR
jgi:hypothetical protein